MFSPYSDWIVNVFFFFYFIRLKNDNIKLKNENIKLKNELSERQNELSERQNEIIDRENDIAHLKQQMNQDEIKIRSSLTKNFKQNYDRIEARWNKVYNQKVAFFENEIKVWQDRYYKIQRKYDEARENVDDDLDSDDDEEEEYEDDEGDEDEEGKDDEDEDNNRESDQSKKCGSGESEGDVICLD